MIKVSVIGAGTMGSGIAQIAATQGHEVCLYDNFDGAIENATEKLHKILNPISGLIVSAFTIGALHLRVH